jgi:hypothetical protein
MTRRAIFGRVPALVAALAVLTLAATGCDMPGTGGLGQVQGSGTLVRQAYDVTGFSRLEADNGFEVRVERGEEYAVSVRVDDNLIEEHLKVEVDGDTLHIGLAPLWNYVGVTAIATVTMPGLEGVEASGAARVVASGFASGDPLSVELSGASSLALSETEAGDVTVELSGGSRVAGHLGARELAGDISGASALVLEGSAAALRLSASGGSLLDLLSLMARDADLELSGGSRGAVLVTGTLDAGVSGGSRLEYAGTPQLGSIDASVGSVVGPAGE